MTSLTIFNYGFVRVTDDNCYSVFDAIETGWSQEKSRQWLEGSLKEVSRGCRKSRQLPIP